MPFILIEKGVSIIENRYRSLAPVTGMLCLVAGVLVATPSAMGAKTPTCAGKDATIVGTRSADVINGTGGPDVIVAKDGKDTINGRRGKDTICGGAGDNSITGGRGDDVLVGGPDHDLITGDLGDDRLLGKAGSDRLYDDESGEDLLTGGLNTDVCTHHPGDSAICEFDTSDPVIFAPSGKAPWSTSYDFSAATELLRVDLYTIIDRSGSMTAESTAIKDNLATVSNTLECPPLGQGTPGNCVMDLWGGAGTVGYSGSGASAFQNWVDIQPNPNYNSVPTSEVSGTNTTEALGFAVYAAITGQGGAAYGMGSVPARTTCAGSPAASSGSTFGYPCFREGALPVVMMATDEAPISASDTYKSPDWSSVVKPQMIARGARFVGIVGDGATASTTADLQQMATDTGAVDANNEEAPLVFQGGGSSAPTAVGNAMTALINGLPLDVRARAVDDAADSVDAATAFVDHLEVLPLGTPECASGGTTTDTDADSFTETYVDVTPGTPLCWRLVARKNTTVPATDSDQIYRVLLEVTADGITQVDEREVLFVVPAFNL